MRDPGRACDGAVEIEDGVGAAPGLVTCDSTSSKSGSSFQPGLGVAVGRPGSGWVSSANKPKTGLLVNGLVAVD